MTAAVGPVSPGVLVATDLDRTLIYSRSAMGDAQFGSVPIRCVEMYRGEPLSYLTVDAARLLASLSAAAPVVPVTTRTPEQYARIALPGGPSRYAVVSSGGRILVDGVDDPRWRRHVEETAGDAGVALDTVVAELGSRVGAVGTDTSWVRALRVADDLFCYLVVDLERQPPEFLPDWQAWCTRCGWMVSQQGRKIYALPATVTKSAAVAEVRRRLIADGALGADAVLYAAGDGRLDIDLLEYADSAIRPRHGELHDIGYARPHLRVTGATGALAGEEIVAWFTDRVAHTDSAPTRPPQIRPTVRTPS